MPLTALAPTIISLLVQVIKLVAEAVKMPNDELRKELAKCHVPTDTTAEDTRKLYMDDVIS